MECSAFSSNIAGSFRRNIIVRSLVEKLGKRGGGEPSDTGDDDDDDDDSSRNMDVEDDPLMDPDYPLVMEEDDPDWPEDADGWGFSLSQFFDRITIKNVKKDEDENYDGENEIVWQDDNYIRPIKDIKTAEWEEAVFKDISPLIVLVHNRYKRPKENERFRDELEKAVHIIWNCRLPSPRCVAVDANVEHDLVSALQVAVFPEVIFTKAGKILYREKVNFLNQRKAGFYFFERSNIFNLTWFMCMFFSN